MSEAGWMYESERLKVEQLRDEVARLKERMQQAYDYINDHRHGKAKAMLFDGLQFDDKCLALPLLWMDCER